MNIKEKLLKLKNKLVLIDTPNSRDFEFNAILEEHPIGNQNIYRLYYIDYHRILEYNGRRDNNVGIIDYPFTPFMLPSGMTREEGFKVLSYLTDIIEKRKDIKACSLSSVKILDEILNLETLGFKKIVENDEDKILNLFTVNGRLLLFKKSNLYDKYFEWYIDDVSFEEVKTIYAKCNIDCKDIVYFNDKIKEKVLKLQK